MSNENHALTCFTARMSTGLTQRGFADLIGAHYSTVANWETGKKAPSKLAISLFKLVTADPDRAKAILGGNSVASQV